MGGLELNDVINKIRKICAKTVDNGCTEAEAMSAARHVGELLKVYNLTMDQVFLQKSECITGYVLTGRGIRGVADRCTSAIATFCDCIVWYSKWGKDGPSYAFFGLETDVEMAKYLHSLIKIAIDGETYIFKMSPEYRYRTTAVHGRRLVVSFQRGMCSRISRRLQEMATIRRSEEDRESAKVAIDTVLGSSEASKDYGPSTTTSIVFLKRKKVESEWEALGVKLGKTYSHSRSTTDSDAYWAGVDAGNHVNLNRPIGSHSNKKLATTTQ